MVWCGMTELTWTRVQSCVTNSSPECCDAMASSNRLTTMAKRITAHRDLALVTEKVHSKYSNSGIEPDRQQLNKKKTFR